MLLSEAFFIWHPLGYCAGAGNHAAVQGCLGYNFWSGIAGSFLTSIPGWLVAGVLFWRSHNCHQQRCPRLSWHPDASGHPVCKVHHPDHPHDGWLKRIRRLVLAAGHHIRK